MKDYKAIKPYKKHRRFKDFLLILVMIIGLLLLSFVLIRFGRIYITSVIQKENRGMSKQQIILECEKLSAIATNEHWSYKTCIDNLKNPDKPKILKI